MAVTCVMLCTWFVQVDLWSSPLRLAFCFGPAITLTGANAWLWLRPMRGGHRWTWWPWSLALALSCVGGLAIPHAEFPSLETLRFWPMSLAFLAGIATFAGALRRGEDAASERPLRDVALRVVLASATLLVIARFGDANAAMRGGHGDPWLADLAVRSVVRSGGWRITCHALVSVLVACVWLAHRRRPRALAVLLPSLAVGLFAAGVLALDLIELRVALDLEGVVISRFGSLVARPPDLTQFEAAAIGAELIGVSLLLSVLCAWTLVLAATVHHPRSAARLGWSEAAPLVVVVVLSTTSWLTPPSDGPLQAPASLRSLGADESFEALTRPTVDRDDMEVLDFTGVVTGIGILTSRGELRTAPGRLTVHQVPVGDFGYPGRPQLRDAAEIIVDRRATLAQVLDAARELRAFESLVVGFRVRPEFDDAPLARRRWSFLEHASRAAAGRTIELIERAEGCGPPTAVAGALYTRCPRHDGGAGDLMVLRDAGRLTVADWFETTTTADDWIAIEVNRAGLGRPRSDDRVWPHDPPRPTHQVSEAWPLSLAGAAVALGTFLWLVRRRSSLRLASWARRVLDLPPVDLGQERGPYRRVREVRALDPALVARALTLRISSFVGRQIAWLVLTVAAATAVGWLIP